jgi:hypothetical protein
VAAFKLGNMVSFTYKHLRERVGTITASTRNHVRYCVTGKQGRVSPGWLRKFIDL